MWTRVGLTMGLWSALGAALAGCRPADPAGDFIRQMDRMPPERQFPNWPRTRQLMLRRAPAVGEDAPDFTLTTPDGGETITRSLYQPGRPQVLIFGSWT